MSRLILVALVAISAGCHAKFKKAAPTLGAVRPQVILTTGPYVELGKVYDDDLVAAIINVVQEAKSVKVSRRLSEAVDVDAVNQAFTLSFVDTLGGGPPFGTTNDENAPVLQAEVLSYGLMVPTLGAPGVFTYDLRIRIYEPDGERVYSTSESCVVNAGQPKGISQALLTVNNIKLLEEMSDEDITASFTAAASWCGAELVRKIRKHAG